MYPSNPSRIGIPSPFGIAPSSVHGVSNLVDDTCGPSFSWLTQSGVQSSSLLNEQSAGGALKIGTADQMIDRSSFMSLDRHTPSLPRLTPHSIVAASSSNSSSLAMESHSGGGGASQQSAAAAADGGVVVGGPFHPYRTANDGMPSVAAGVAHPSLSNSQFAAFDSIYKAYQNAYGSSSAAAAAAGMFGNQQYRYDSSLLAAEQQMLLQASLLQYPHLGIFPNAALYPNLQSGLRYPGDYYCQNLASLSLLSKYPDMTGPSWLGIDRSSAMSAFPSEREKELKEYDPRKDQPDPSKRFEREALLSEHHKARHDRDDVRREPPTDDARKDHSSSSSSASRHHADKEGLKNEQQKRSTSLRSPARHEHRHQDPSFSKFNAGHNEFTYTASRLQSGVTCATTMEPLNLQKSLLSPSSTIHQQQQQQQRHAASRRDRNFELPQDYALAKERHQMGLHSKSDDMRDKRLPSTLSGLPKPASSVMNPVMSPAQFKGQYEQKFHRPFEQGHQPSANDPGEATERQLGGLPSSHRDRLPSNTKTSLVYERKDYTGPSRATSDGKSLHENHRHQHQQQQLLAKANDRKMQALTPTASKRRSTELNDEMPLNLALTKVAHMDSSANGEQERGGQGRPRIDLLAQESAGMTNAVGNSYVRRKSVTGGVPGNSAVRSSDKTRRGDYVGPDAGYKASSCSLQQKPLVSKLDVMIARKTKSAAAGNSDDEMDEEKWENTCKEVAKCLLITSGPALADENSHQKIQFLGIFGLVTTDAFKELEFKQHQRRRHQMHESSLSPIQLDSEPASSAAAAGGDLHPPPSSVFNDKLDAAETSRSSTDKDSLLHLLHLRSVKTQGDQQRGSSVQLSSHVDHLPVPSAKATTPLHQISKRHRHPVERSNSTTPPRCTNRVDGCDVERERLHQQQQQQLMMMGTEFLTHLRTSSAYDKLQQNDNSSSSSSRRPMMLDHPPFAFDANRSQQKSRALASDLQTTTGPSCQDHCNHSTATDGAGGGGGALDVVSSHPPPCLSDASSLHTKSATRSTSSLMISKELIDGSSPLSSARHHTAAAAASSSDMESAFNWPGHEAIIESYYHYIEERSMERQLLSEQNRRLHHLNNDLVLKSEQLRSHMTGLLQTKEQLAGNRCRLQSAVDDLKVCLKSLQ